MDWQEEHFVVFVHDVYKTKKHGRVIEFYSEQGGYRVVPLAAIRVTEAGQRKIQKSRREARRQATGKIKRKAQR